MGKIITRQLVAYLTRTSAHVNVFEKKIKQVRLLRLLRLFSNSFCNHTVIVAVLYHKKTAVTVYVCACTCYRKAVKQVVCNCNC